MRLTVHIILCMTLLFGVSLNLLSQSAEEELDQAELMKQFRGTWELPVSEDSLIVATITPFGDGLSFKQENKANGKTYSSSLGLWGVSSDKKTIESVGLDESGNIDYSVGKFVSPKKFVTEDNYGNPYVVRISEFEIESPVSIIYRIKVRGEDMSWDCDWRYTFKLKKVD
jgi:hypothetical protein